MWLDSKAVNCPQKWGNFSIDYGHAGIDPEKARKTWPK